MNIILIDADSLCYIGGSCEDVNQAFDKVDVALSNIIEKSNSTHYQIFVEKSGNNNFRKKIVKSYKEGRKNKELPMFYKEIKEYLIGSWNAYGISGYESDDLIVSAWRKAKREYPFNEVLIASMDKDLKQYPIKMFDTYYSRFGTIHDVSNEDAEYNFYYQMILGDSTDSIKGVKGKGKKKAEDALNGAKNKFIATCRVYRSVYGSRWQKHFISNYVQVKLLDNLNVTLDFNQAEFEQSMAKKQTIKNYSPSEKDIEIIRECIKKYKIGFSLEKVYNGYNIVRCKLNDELECIKDSLGYKRIDLSKKDTKRNRFVISNQFDAEKEVMQSYKEIIEYLKK